MTASTTAGRTTTLLVSLVAVFLVPLTLTGASVALTDIQRDLGAGLAGAQWVVNAYSATFAGFLLVTGSLADKFGRRRTFAAGVGLFAGCAVVSAVAPGIVLLDVARLLAGIGAAATTTGASAMLAEVFQGPARAKVFGLFGTTIGVGLAFGPTIAGLLQSELGWRAVFAVPGVVGLVLLAFFPVLPATSERDSTKLDVAGAALFTTALLLLIFALVEGPELGWGHGLVLGAFAAAVLLFVVFVPVERRVENPVLRLEVFATPRFAALCGAITAIVGVFGPLLVYLPSYFQGVLGMSTREAGLSIVLLTGPTLVVPVLCGWLVKWVPGLRQVVFALLLVGAGAAWLAGTGSWVGPLLVMGVGIAIAQGLLDGLAVGSVQARFAGIAAGAFNTAKVTAETVGIAAVGAAVAGATGGELAGPAYEESLRGALWVFAALAFAVALLVIALDRRAAPDRTTTEHSEREGTRQ
ncbi:MFS transporter [Saccharopolyspora sp. NPDC047091]|uniref:MFS transporter n=1 Tax=Saccharopolyspora sp. NPDC047091 TaxID=3155924 RepID=UPI003410F6E9